MDKDRYRHLPLKPTRFYTVVIPRVRRKSWLKVDDTGTVLEASPSFQWAAGKAIELVESWCKMRELVIKRMHGNIENIKPYL